MMTLPVPPISGRLVSVQAGRPVAAKALVEGPLQPWRATTENSAGEPPCRAGGSYRRVEYLGCYRTLSLTFPDGVRDLVIRMSTSCPSFVRMRRSRSGEKPSSLPVEMSDS